MENTLRRILDGIRAEIISHMIRRNTAGISMILIQEKRELTIRLDLILSFFTQKISSTVLTHCHTHIHKCLLTLNSSSFLPRRIVSA